MEEVLGILVIFAIILLLILDRKNIKREGIFFIRRSKLFLEKIESFGKKYEKIINIFGNISIFISFLVSVFALYFLINLLFVKTKEPTVQIILPSLPFVCEKNVFLCLPAHYWLIIILLVAFSHEIAHAILSAANKVKIKSIGYAFLAIIPAFFVEPDNKKFEKAKTIQKLRILSVGSVGNFLLAIFTILLIFLIYFITLPFSKFEGLEVKVIPNSSAYFANLSGTILKVDGRDATIKNLKEIIANKRENENITIETTEGVYELKLINRTIGIIIEREKYSPSIFEFSKNFYNCIYLRDPIYCSFIYNSFVFWLIVISIGVAVFNLLPLKPLDGGKMWEEIFKLIFPKKYREISNALSITVLLIVIFLLLRPLF